MSSAVHSLGKPEIVVNEAFAPDWDSKLSLYPQSTIFHTTAWSRVLQDTYHFLPIRLSQYNPDGPSSELLLMEVNSRLTGRRAISLPFTDQCEPLCSNPELMRHLFEEAIALGKTRAWKYLEFRGGRSLLPEAQASLQFYGHLLNLDASDQTLFAQFDGSVRQAIRKAQKAGVVVEVSHSLEAVQTYYKLHGKTRQKHGVPPQPFAFFRAIHDHLISKDMGAVFLAKHNNQPIAAAIHLYFGRQATYKFGASDEAFQHLRANNLVMWEAIQWHRHRGIKSLHLGRSSLAGEGLRRFKLNLGALEHAIDYVKFDFKKNQFVTETDQAHGWHTRILRLLPPPASRLLGAILYPHMA